MLIKASAEREEATTTALSLLIILAILGFQLINRTFDLIHIIPDQVLERIGMGIKPLGDMGHNATSSVMGAYARSSGTRSVPQAAEKGIVSSVSGPAAPAVVSGAGMAESLNKSPTDQ